MKIMDLAIDCHGTINIDLRDWMIEFDRENGIHQVDTFLHVLPFLPFENFTEMGIRTFSKRAIQPGLQFYMEAIEIYHHQD